MQSKHLLIYITSAVPTSSSSPFQSRSPVFTVFGDIFFYLATQVVTFRLRGWCILGVFLLSAFTCLGHVSGSFQNVLWNACECRLDLGLYSHLKEFLGNRVRTHFSSKEKNLYWRLRGVSNPQRCISQDSKPNTLLTELFCRPAYTKILRSVLRTAYVRIFRFFYWIFFQVHHQSKQNSVKYKFFYHSSYKNSVWTHIFNIQTHHTRTTFFCLHLRKSFSIEDHRTLSPKTMHHVCCFRWCRHILSWTVVVWLEFVSLVSCILYPLHWFHAATYHDSFKFKPAI